MTTTVSAKIPDDLKDQIDRENVNVSETIRDALADEVTRRRREELSEDIKSLRETIGGRVDTGDIVRSIRNDRDEGH